MSRGTPKIDVAIVAAFQQGDRAALAHLYEQVGPLVRNYLWMLVRDPETADDLTHDVFLMMYRDREQLRHPERIVSWIMRIAHSAGYTSLRKKRRRSAASIDDDSGYYADTLADESVADPVEGIQSDARAVLLGPALETLRDKEREIVWMTYFLELKQREIADALDIPIGSVGTTLKRALDKLKTHFEGQGFSPEDLL